MAWAKGGCPGAESAIPNSKSEITFGLSMFAQRL